MTHCFFLIWFDLFRLHRSLYMYPNSVLCTDHTGNPLNYNHYIRQTGDNNTVQHNRLYNNVLPLAPWHKNYTRCQKRLQAFRRYSTHLKEQKSQSIYVQKQMPSEIWAMFVWTLHNFQLIAQRCAYFKKFLGSLISPDRQRSEDCESQLTGPLHPTRCAA
jgi:hypothetical protein